MNNYAQNWIRLGSLVLRSPTSSSATSADTTDETARQRSVVTSAAEGTR